MTAARPDVGHVSTLLLAYEHRHEAALHQSAARLPPAGCPRRDPPPSERSRWFDQLSTGSGGSGSATGGSRDDNGDKGIVVATVASFAILTFRMDYATRTTAALPWCDWAMCPPRQTFHRGCGCGCGCGSGCGCECGSRCECGCDCECGCGCGLGCGCSLIGVATPLFCSKYG